MTRQLQSSWQTWSILEISSSNFTLVLAIVRLKLVRRSSVYPFQFFKKNLLTVGLNKNYKHKIMDEEKTTHKHDSITWKMRSRIQSDFSDILPNCLKNRFTTVPSFVPVSSPVCGSNLRMWMKNVKWILYKVPAIVPWTWDYIESYLGRRCRGHLT